MLAICPPLTPTTVDLSAPEMAPEPVLTGLEERFELQEELGFGGQGAVYRAVQRFTGRPVAVKVVHAPEPQPHQRLFREAALLSRVKHAGVVALLDAGAATLDGERVSFVALELLEGRPLRDVLATERIGSRRALRLIRGALDALDAIHRAGIVHRDLKPANLMLVHPGTPRERIVIVDFGLAWSDEQARMTRTGRIVGTPQYLAPEMLGRSAPTAALDVYQMALVLVEMLTGEPVVRPTSPSDCMRQHHHGVELPDGLPRDVRAAVQRALRKNPAERFATAAELRRALFRRSRLGWVAAGLGMAGAFASAAMVLLVLGLALVIPTALATVGARTASPAPSTIASLPADDAHLVPTRTERAFRPSPPASPKPAAAPVTYAPAPEVAPVPTPETTPLPLFY